MLLSVFSSNGLTAYGAEGASNYPLNSIVIKLEDTITHAMLGGGRFEIYYANEAMSGGYGTLVATVDTDGSGVIVLSGIPSGYYIVRQTVPPNNYALSINNEQHCYIKPDGTSIEELVFSDYRYGGLVVFLDDKDTGTPIAGAKFSVTDVNGATVGNAADGIYTTDARGEFYLENLPAGDYKITQMTAAQGYAMDSSPNMRTVRLQHTSADQSVFRAEFSNSPLGTLLVRVKDSVSAAPLAGAVFNVKMSGGADLGEFSTDAQGTFTLAKIARGTYIVTQITAPAGYLLESTAKTQYVDYVSTFAVDIVNKPKSGLYVTKYDAATKSPLKDATFKVYQDSTLIGSYTTNSDGVFFIPDLVPGWYTVSEYAAPQGYILDDTPKSVQVIAEQLHRLEFEDSKLASLQVVKTDEFSGEPLAGAKFRVTKQNGEFVADVATDSNGKAIIPEIAPGWYVISETKAPVGYLITEAARTVEVKATVPTVVTITNRAENNLEIVKLDYFSRTPLAGAIFKVEHANGANVGTFITDSTGKILVGSLTEDTYVISEVKAPDGYQLDSEPQVIVVQGGKLQSAEFLDKPLSGVQIIKTDANTHAPLQGAVFTIERTNGERIGDKYTTDSAGKIIVPDLIEGVFIVSEVQAPANYLLDVQPQTVTVKSGILTTVEFTNKPLAGLKIIKLDSATRQPIAGVEFAVSKMDGERVEDGFRATAFKTDEAGQIYIPQLADGYYTVTETKAADGYVLDGEPKTVLVQSGRTTLLEVTNTQKSGLRLLKIDSVTKKSIYNVEFMVFDSNNKVVGNFVTDNNGVIDFTGLLSAGRYTIRETRPADGYYSDDVPRTVEIVSGKVTEIVWENTPQLGQIQIKKLSGDDNEVNGLPKGSPLADAVFEVYNYKSGNLVDRFVSGTDGRAVSKPLPLGRYVVKEVQAPAWYRLSAESMDIEVEFATQIIKRDFLNFSANTGVTIKKTGNYEAMPGDTIRYDIKEVRNTSTVPLTDFYWRDTLPTDTVRLTKIVTGTYSQSLKYKILVTTNKGDTKIIADNLSTTVNNTIDCRNAALGLASDEYVTSFTLVFGTVKAGFAEVEKPQVYATVKTGLPNGYEFGNKADIGGKYGSEWIIGNSVWVVKIYSNVILPRTGY
jgi:uncharacterized repeat protein (TIGR01451 family)